jgi:outer membrane immunogenic protein
VYNWTGCYIGGNIGWGQTDHRYRDVLGRDEGSHRSDGFVGGGQIGCDYQFASNWVVGIQGMADWADFSDDHASLLFPANHLHSHTRWFGTVTGRLGFTVTPALLVYGKAGWGFVHDRNTLVQGGVETAVANDDNFSGVDAGGGLEWMFAPNWSLFVEYDHIFRSSKALSYAATTGGVSFNESVRRDFDKVLLGLNWRFGGGPVRSAY